MISIAYKAIKASGGKSKKIILLLVLMILTFLADMGISTYLLIEDSKFLIVFEDQQKVYDEWHKLHNKLTIYYEIPILLLHLTIVVNLNMWAYYLIKI